MKSVLKVTVLCVVLGVSMATVRHFEASGEDVDPMTYFLIGWVGGHVALMLQEIIRFWYEEGM